MEGTLWAGPGRRWWKVRYRLQARGWAGVSRGRCRSIPATGLQENPFLQLDQGRAGWRRGFLLPPGLTSEAPAPPALAQLQEVGACDLSPPSSSTPPCPAPWAAATPSTPGSERPPSPGRWLQPSPLGPHPVGSIMQGSPTSCHSWPGNQEPSSPWMLPHSSQHLPAKVPTHGLSHSSLPLSELPRAPPLPACKSPDWAAGFLTQFSGLWKCLPPPETESHLTARESSEHS